jgi:hypothetical protein
MTWRMLIPILIQAILALGALLLIHKPPYTKKEIIGTHLIFWAFVLYAGWSNFSVTNNLTDWIFPVILGLSASSYSLLRKEGDMAHKGQAAPTRMKATLEMIEGHLRKQDREAQSRQWYAVIVFGLSLSAAGAALRFPRFELVLLAYGSFIALIGIAVAVALAIKFRGQL